ncbi:MAG: AbrB/MazE/SpoVT family DNA-binding domain-containing protein [Opitutaceae bacterium]
MQVTITAKGQIVLPAPMRRRLRLRARSKVVVEEREGGIFIRTTSGTTEKIEPIDYPPRGALKFGARDYELDKFAAAVGEDDTP